MKNRKKEAEKAVAKMTALEDQLWMLIQESPYLEILIELKNQECDTDKDFVVMLCASLVYGKLAKSALDEEDLEDTIET